VVNSLENKDFVPKGMDWKLKFPHPNGTNGFYWKLKFPHPKEEEKVGG
jgi:hypothetical protein